MKPLALFSDFRADLGYGGGAVLILITAISESSAELFIHSLTGIRGESKVSSIQTPIASIQEHALSRMNQRIGLIHVPDLLALLMPSITQLAAIALSICYGNSKIRQVSVPFAGGALRCSVDDNNHLIIKTYVATPSTRERPLIHDLEKVFDDASEDSRRDFLWLPVRLDKLADFKDLRQRSHLLKIAELGVALKNALKEHQWAFEPYEKRPEPEGDAWDMARHQESDQQ